MNGTDGGCHLLRAGDTVVPLTGTVFASGGDHVVVTAYGSQTCNLGTGISTQAYDLQSNLTAPSGESSIVFSVTQNFWQFRR